MRHADGGGRAAWGFTPHGRVGIARILGWYCEDPGMVLRGSWDGSSVVAIVVIVKKCKKNAKKCNNYCIYEKKAVSLHWIWE